jgi:hypothetical protein
MEKYHFIWKALQPNMNTDDYHWNLIKRISPNTFTPDPTVVVHRILRVLGTSHCRMIGPRRYAIRSGMANRILAFLATFPTTNVKVPVFYFTISPRRLDDRVDF